jgi:hypothetical protein
MSSKSICIAGKNSIAIEGLSYVIDKYSHTHKIFALGDKNDCEKDSWQPSYIKYAKDCCQNLGNTHGIKASINAGAKIEAKDIFRKSIYDYLNKDSIYYNKIVNLLDL